MSSIWSPKDHGDVAPVAGLGAFGSLSARGAFNSRFGAAGDGTGWSAARAGTPDTLPPEPAIDPIEQAAQDAFVMGFQEGDRLAREAADADDSARIALAEAVRQLAASGEGALAALLGEAVLRLVHQIVGEVPVDEAVLAARCATVAACIEGEDGKAVLEVNPEDLALIESDGLGVTLAANPGLSRGSVRLATSDGWIEDGPDVRLGRLRALMDDMEGRL